MEITEVRVFPVDEEKLKAFVSVVFDNCFIISDIKIIAGSTGLFLSMPSKKGKNGKFRDIAHPLNSETRSKLEEAIIGEYNRLMAEGLAGSVFPAADGAPQQSEGHGTAAD